MEGLHMEYAGIGKGLLGLTTPKPLSDPGVRQNTYDRTVQVLNPSSFALGPRNAVHGSALPNKGGFQN